MTLPYERTCAVVRAEEFLLSLIDPKKTPRIPHAIRQEAHRLLRHYPSKFDMDVISEREDMNPSIAFHSQTFGTLNDKT